MPRTDRFTAVDVETMPKQLLPGMLYVSPKFSTAAHLCACGCGEKVRTPLGPSEWSVERTPEGPSLRPSVGNWQKPCKSHYWILRGEVHWSGAWSEEQIIAGRAKEEHRRQEHFATQAQDRKWYIRLLKWLGLI